MHFVLLFKLLSISSFWLDWEMVLLDQNLWKIVIKFLESSKLPVPIVSGSL